eukprot:m.5552 g.5552  ORF g.5552 m.5552 type:complete len:58 (-) comp5050_c0_seq1:29-202(-)
MLIGKLMYESIMDKSQEKQEKRSKKRRKEEQYERYCVRVAQLAFGIQVIFVLWLPYG